MKKFLFLPALLLLGARLQAQDPVLVITEKAGKSHPPVTVTLTGVTGERIKDIDGINMAPPLKRRGDDYREHWFGALGAPIVRLHDMVHADPGLNPCDLNHIFPIESADPSRRENYDFSVTDAFIRQLSETGCPVLWRLGSSIENMDEYHYGIHPPASYKTWAESAVQVIEHYTRGKWDGFTCDIPYWEIWNEPDNKHCWSGTADEFIEFYIAAAKHIKKKCPWVKVGGPGFTTSSAKNCKPFIEACAAEGAPLDFISYHGYLYKEGDDSGLTGSADLLRTWLDAAGFNDTEIFFDEWHPISSWKNVKRTLDPDWAVLTGSIMLAFQDSPIDKAFFYTGGIGPWGYMSQSGEIQPVYHVARAVAQLRRAGRRVAVRTDQVPDGSRALAACDDTGDVTALLALYKAGRGDVTFDFSALGTFGEAEVFLFDKTHALTRVARESRPSGSICISTDEASALAMLRLHRSGAAAPEGTVTVSTEPAGRFKPLNGGNHGPALKSYGVHFKTKYFPAMRIPVTRLSNEALENSGLRLVNTDQVFPLPGADPSRKENYDFRATDDFINQVYAAGTEVFYCLTATDERLIDRMHFRLDPPDVDRWKQVCENIIRHYNQGRWDGFRRKIRWWEIGEEPDNPHCWGGTLEEYFDLYTRTAVYLKERFPDIRVGGPSFEMPTEEKVSAFLAACRAAGAPLDFFSYKMYAYAEGDFEKYVCSADRLRTLLDEAGYRETQIVISAWHPGPDRDRPASSLAWTTLNASLMMAWQDRPVDLALFDSVIGNAAGVYAVPDPKENYYLFVAFADLMEHPDRLALSCAGLSLESRALAGKDRAGDVDVLLSLRGMEAQTVRVACPGTFRTAEVYVFDAAGGGLSKVYTGTRPSGALDVCFNGPDALVLVKWKR